MAIATITATMSIFDSIPAHTGASQTKTPSTVGEARACANYARECFVSVTINGDTSVDVRVSRAALLRSLAGLTPDTPCGGTYWLDDDSFMLRTTY